MSKSILTLLVIASICFTWGCHAITKSMVFDVAVMNMGSRAALDNVTIEFLGYSHDFGTLGKHSGNEKSQSLFVGNWPALAKIKWRFRDDRPYAPDHEVTLNVPAHPKLERGDYLELQFELDGKQVKARCKVWVKPAGQGSSDFKWY